MSAVSKSRCMATRTAAPAAPSESRASIASACARSHASSVTSRWPEAYATSASMARSGPRRASPASASTRSSCAHCHSPRVTAARARSINGVELASPISHSPGPCPSTVAVTAEVPTVTLSVTHQRGMPHTIPQSGGCAMERTEIDGVTLRHEVTGSGEPVLLISTGPIADSFLPFVSEKVLADDYSLIRYRQRRRDTSAPAPMPVSFEEHAADVAGLLAQLELRRVHVVGHSTGAVIALQMAVDHPDVVHSLTLMEPTLLMVPSAGAFLDQAAP